MDVKPGDRMRVLRNNVKAQCVDGDGFRCLVPGDEVVVAESPPDVTFGRDLTAGFLYCCPGRTCLTSAGVVIDGHQFLPFADVESIFISRCTCSIRDLMIRGCRCGHLKSHGGSSCSGSSWV